MNFLNPGILFGLFAAAIPLLIHFLNRSKSKNIPFSTLVFLKELQQQKIRRIKIKQLLLLIIRTLIIIFLVLAFARPSIRGPLSGGMGSNANTSAVLILDNSYSMDCLQENRTLLSIAKSTAQRITDQMRQGDEVYLFTSTDSSQDVSRQIYHDFDLLKQDIQKKSIDFHPANLSASIKTAHDILQKSANINKEIYLLSDLQQSAFGRDSSKIISDNIKAIAFPLVKKPVNNLLIKEINIVSTIIEKGKLVELEGVFVNTGDVPSGNKLAQLFINEEKTAQTTINLEPKTSTTESFKFLLNKTGFISGYILLEDDDLNDDNKRYFSLFVPDQIKIAISGVDAFDTQIIELALNPGTIQKSNFLIKEVSLPKMSLIEAEQYDVIVLSNSADILPETVEQIKEFVESGGGFFLVLGDKIDVNVYNRLLSRLGLPKILNVIGGYSVENPVFSLSREDLTHPIFHGMFESETANYAKPGFRFAFKMEEQQGVDKIMLYSTGDPFLLEKKSKNGTMLVMTTGLRPELSDITRRTIFAPLMTRIVSYAGYGKYSRPQNLNIGQFLNYKPGPDLISSDLEMKRPDLQYDRLEPDVRPNGAWINYPGTDIPGIYSLVAKNNVNMQWAVNVYSIESDLTQIEPTVLKDRYNITLADPNSDMQKLVTQNRYGFELWKYFVFFAFLLLIIEMILYRADKSVETEQA
ncbi:BatA domain-containing protein [candidate division KSB1 bacterium]|nr:BatA domain-containing protein [candidate division KSB1 bacterium]